MNRKDLQKLIREAEGQGFSVTLSRNGHYKVRDSEGRFVVTTGSTPSDTRGPKNFLAALRRHGFIDKKGRS